MQLSFTTVDGLGHSDSLVLLKKQAGTDRILVSGTKRGKFLYLLISTTHILLVNKSTLVILILDPTTIIFGSAGIDRSFLSKCAIYFEVDVKNKVCFPAKREVLIHAFM